MFWPILLLVLSFALIAAEVFFPSFGALSVGAILCLITAIGMAFREGTTEGALFVFFALAGAIGAVSFARRLLPKTPFGKKLMLIGEEPTPEQRRAVDPGIAALMGKQGIARSFLRPAGIAAIEGRRVDVVSLGEPIAEGEKIRVIQVDGNRVVVAASAPTKNSDSA